MPIMFQTLFIELLHTFGLSLLIFHILPRMDMARGVIILCGVSTVPTFFKSINVSCDSSIPRVKRCTLGFINCLAFLVQLANLPGSTIFGSPLTENEKNALKSTVLNSDNILQSINRQSGSFENRTMWEVPVALLFISITYWENFVSSNFCICSFRIPLLEWKKQMHSVRQRLFIFAGLWKIGWTMVFAVLLLPGFKFNMTFTETSDANPSNLFDPKTETTTLGMNNETTELPPSTTTLFVPSLPGYEGTGRNLRVRRSIAEDIRTRGIGAVMNLSSTTLQQHQKAIFGTLSPLKGSSVVLNETTTKANPAELQPQSTKFSLTIPEYLQTNFQRYGPLYLHLIAGTLMSYFGSLACKLCMQTFGFTIPLFLATPVTLGIIIAQSYTQFIRSHFYIWICPEMGGSIRLFHLLWLGVLWCSQIIVTAHIWSPKNGRMAKIDR